ncbi:hypothetical protein A0H81_11667 [Grifola frondosa]|uniref:Uncharacterized protein n=1 Tax=Grifola frondosa TaxID=5627 RepID=A0A1C7LVB7_GRIFR|nr:hypothetical protein A0H81_11667 [Grifola frondosa]
MEQAVRSALNALIKEPVLSAKSEVPIYDGTTPFNLATFQELPRISMQLDNGSAVTVLFMINTYTAKVDMHTSVSLNIQYVILLANPIPESENSAIANQDVKDIHPEVDSDYDDDNIVNDASDERSDADSMEDPGKVI